MDLRSYINEVAEKGSTTVYDLISRMPEQTLKRAQEELPAKKKGIHFIVSCKGRRQKFGIDTRGMVFCPKLWNVRDGVPEYSLRSKYANRFLWDNDTITYNFGFPDIEPEGRHLERGYLPIIYAKWVEDGVVYEQEAFATLLFKDVLGDLNGEEMIDGDDPIACMVKITITSQSPSCKKVNLKLASIAKGDWRDLTGVSEWLEYKDGFVFASPRESISERRLRFFLDTKDKETFEAGILLTGARSATSSTSWNLNLVKATLSTLRYRP